MLMFIHFAVEGVHEKGDQPKVKESYSFGNSEGTKKPSSERDVLIIIGKKSLSWNIHAQS